MTTTDQDTRLDFPVKGMHCAACVGKVEHALLGVPGVRMAAVNLATERATVERAPGGPLFADLRQAVAAAGYTVPAETAVTPETVDREQALRQAEDRLLRVKVLVGAGLSVPVLLGSMPEVFPWAPAGLRNPWLLWILTTPVQFWVGGQFHRSFLRELRHRSTSMNTLVSIGTNAAYFFSVAVTVWPHAFMATGAMPYYEASALLMTFLVLGRWLEDGAGARGRRRAGPPHQRGRGRRSPACPAWRADRRGWRGHRGRLQRGRVNADR
jgi:P-type Cu+ transporter